MSEKTPIRTLQNLKEEAKKLPKDIILMTIDPKDPGQFIRVAHMEVRFMHPDSLIEGKEVYFENEAMEAGTEPESHTEQVLVLYAAQD